GRHAGTRAARHQAGQPPPARRLAVRVPPEVHAAHVEPRPAHLRDVPHRAARRERRAVPPHRRVPALLPRRRADRRAGGPGVPPLALRHALRAARHPVPDRQRGRRRGAPRRLPRAGHDAPRPLPRGVGAGEHRRAAHPPPRRQGRVPDVRRDRGRRPAHGRLHHLQAAHARVAAAQPHRPGRDLPVHEGARRDRGLRRREVQDVRAQHGAARRGHHPAAQLPPGVQPRRGDALHLVPRRGALLGGRQAQGVPDRLRGHAHHM
ncbi:MAG: hypothetical protein AVDCRST_MAG11-2604, partial [uncultured Gemmatimonadaceae bacterium]